MILDSTIRIAVLLIPVLCTEPLFAQDQSQASDRDLNPVAIGIAPESQHRHCFEQPNGAKDAIRRLPPNAHYWLAEDAIYIITPEERCEFVHLNSDEEREQFIDQFWYRRSVDPISLDYDFKTEFYRRIVVANEKYGSKLFAGRNTDRGRLYVIFGPPDSTDDPAAPHSMETWHYHYIKGIGENVQIRFEYNARYDDYVLPDADRELVGRRGPNPDYFPVTPEGIDRLAAVYGPRKVRFKDLEAISLSRVLREQVKFGHRIEFTPATRATTWASINIQIPCETCTHEGQISPSSAYPLFIRVTRLASRVVATSELTADNAVRDLPHSGFNLNARVGIPLAPGVYQLAIVAKNSTTGEVGVLHTQLEVPTYESLGMKN